MLQKILILHFFAVQIYTFAHPISKMNRQKYHFSGIQSGKKTLLPEHCRIMPHRGVSGRFIPAHHACSLLKMNCTTFIPD